MVFIGMSSRVMVKVSVFFDVLRFTPILTFVPFSPRILLRMPSAVSVPPTIDSPLTEIMRSPASIPTFSAGPLGITWSTLAVSFIMKNDTPMPLIEPSSFSFSARMSEAGM